ncbi:MAG: hypothetical protein IPN76_11270 [Saprospiraceae bacterium]|nr:hypothetical protein [Saprospiraceae bacterium]
MNNRLRLGLLAGTSVATLALGWNMYSLWQAETLWGHRPLFFFVLAWASIVLLFWKKYTRHPKGLRWLGLSTLSAVLLALSFPPFPTTILLFIAWVPLLIIEYEVAKERSTPNPQSKIRNPQSDAPFNPSILQSFNPSLHLPRLRPLEHPRNLVGGQYGLHCWHRGHLVERLVHVRADLVLP